jgi:nitrogen-specific signal transduction histidine kinase
LEGIWLKVKREITYLVTDGLGWQPSQDGVTEHLFRLQKLYRSIEITDVSELKKLEAQLQQSQKMEAIGTLAGGIAHDFNNILSGVLGYASLLKKHTPPESQLAHYAEMIEKSAERGATLAGQLLAFSRKGKRFIQTVEVHQLIEM